MLVWVIAVIAVLQPKDLDLCLKIKQCSSFLSKQVTQILVSTERATLTQNFTYTVSAKILRVHFLQWFVLIIYIKLNLTLMNVSPSFFKSQKCCWIQIQNQLIFLLKWYFFLSVYTWCTVFCLHLTSRPDFYFLELYRIFWILQHLLLKRCWESVVLKHWATTYTTWWYKPWKCSQNSLF